MLTKKGIEEQGVCAVWFFPLFKVLLGGWTEEAGERSHENVENRHITGCAQPPSLQIPGSPCVLPQELIERSPSPVWVSFPAAVQCWSSQLVHISKADHDEGSCNCTLSPPSKVFTCSYWAQHTRGQSWDVRRVRVPLKRSTSQCRGGNKRKKKKKKLCQSYKWIYFDSVGWFGKIFMRKEE